jgi:hypothetical protein
MMIKYLARLALLTPILGAMLFMWALYDDCEFDLVDKMLMASHGIFIGALAQFSGYLL